jgi:hypothetical protein
MAPESVAHTANLVERRRIPSKSPIAAAMNPPLNAANEVAFKYARRAAMANSSSLASVGHPPVATATDGTGKNGYEV